MAGLFSSAMSTFSSTNNAVASCRVADLHLPGASWRARRRGVTLSSDISMAKLSESRLAVGLIGAGLTAFAVGAVFLQQAGGDTLINFALGVMAYALAPLLGVFCTALFTRRGNLVSVYAALITGIVLVQLLQPYMVPAWIGVKIAFPWWWVIVSPICFAICAAGRPKQATDDV